MLGLSVTLAITFYIHTGNQKRVQSHVENASSSFMVSALDRVKHYQHGLREAQSIVLTLGKGEINRETFRRYYSTRHMTSEFPGANGFGFIRRVPQAEKDAFVAAIRANDWPNFTIKELTEHDSDHYVIQYIEPFSVNHQAIGLDIASEQNRFDAALAAIRHNDVRLTGPITLVQETGSPLQSFLILMPMYETTHAPATVQAREESAFGLSYAPLLISKVLNELVIDNTSVQLYDVTESSKPILFYESSKKASTEPQHQLVQRHNVYGRLWESHFSVSPTFVEAIPLLSATHIGLFGVAVSFLMACLAGAIASNRKHHLEFITHQAQLAAIVESSADGIIGKTLTGKITSWNHGAEQIFGYSSEEAIGRSIRDLIIPDELQGEETAILKKIRNGQSIPHFETIRKNKDNQRIAVSVTVSPVYGKNGTVIGASKTLRDISKQKENEAQIYQLNNHLEAQVKKRTQELANLNLLLSNVLRAASEVSIIATDTNGLITLFNEGAERMLGYQANEVIGKCSPVSFYLAAEIEERAKELSSLYDRHVEGLTVFTLKPELEGSERREWTCVHKTGLNFPVSLVVTKMLDEDDKTIGYLSIASNITEQHNFNSKLMTARDQLLMAAGVAELGIWSWQIEEDILEWNDKMFALYELPMTLKYEGLSYHHWLECVHSDDEKSVREKLEAAINGEDEYNPIFRIVLPNGKLRYIEANAYVEKDDKGKPVKITGINRDVTSERELQLSLRHAKEQADTANQAKSAFLANMSHEIRTPMNAILGLLQLLQKTELSTQQIGYLDKTQIAAKTLLKLLNDILDYSKMDVNKLELDPHTFELESLIQDLAAILSGGSNEGSVELIFDLDTDIPQQLIGDRMRLLQILINLVSNALKFTLQGHVILAVRKQYSTSTSITLRIKVSDTGIGISAEQQKKIFDGFSQAEASITRQFGGSGLGLAISKQLVNLMGSELNLISRLYEGSSFWFDLTLDIAESNTISSQQKTPIQFFAHREVSLLIIEHNKSKSEILKRLFSSVGSNTVIVDSEKEAFKAINTAILNEKAFDIVLLDWHIFEVKNLEFIDSLSETRGLSQFAIIIMITASQYEQLMQLRQFDNHAFIHFVIKPITSLQLLTAIERTTTGEATQNRPAPMPSAPARLIGIKVLVIEDNAINRQVVVELLSIEGAQVTVVTGGLEGVNTILNKAQSFDIVLMDMQMPDIDGLQATKQIRADKRFTELPIVAMTANVSNADKEACLSAGMNAHLSKPLDLNLMVNTIIRFTERQADLFKINNVLTPRDIIQLTANNIRQNNSLVESSTSVLKRFGDNASLYKKLLESFEHTAENLFQQVQKHIKNKNKQQTFDSLHTLKGTAGTIGARQFFSTVEKIEDSLKTNMLEEKEDTLNLDFVDIDALRHLLKQEIAVLRDAIDLREGERQEGKKQEDKKIEQTPFIRYNPATLKEQLELLHDLLKAGNLNAIESAKEFILIEFLDEQLQQQITELVELINELQFSEALILLEKIRPNL